MGNGNFYFADYRGPNGVWTKKEKGFFTGGFDIEETYPTYAHYAITELTRHQLVHFIISTNMDGLHLRTGLPVSLISEVHGNSYKERCEECEREYYRQYDTLFTVIKSRSHLTGRYCDVCEDANLKDTIVHFSEKMFKKDNDSAMYHSSKSDLALVLGYFSTLSPQ